MSYDKLFSPLTLKNCTFPNRVMRTAMVSGLAGEDGLVTDILRERYRREAKGGVGALVIEGTTIHPTKSPYLVQISDDRFIPGLTELVETVHEANPRGKVGVQIMHWMKLSFRTGWVQKVEDLKAEELPVMVDHFVAAARRARTAGFDFIELHMAHCYTLGSFLSLVNKRPDEYGGRLENRMRLPVAVYQAVRQAIGDDYPIGMRMNGDDFIIGGNTLLHTIPIARKFAQLGVDFISVSAGDKFEDAAPPPPGEPPNNVTGYSGNRFAPPWWTPDGVNVYLAAEIKSSLLDAGFDVPVVTVGKIRTPQLAEKILVDGRADIIGLCRPLLCDPDWPAKAEEGKEKDIVRCAACNSCLEQDWRAHKPKCARWPEGVLVAPEPFLPAMARPAKLSS